MPYLWCDADIVNAGIQKRMTCGGIVEGTIFGHQKLGSVQMVKEKVNNHMKIFQNVHCKAYLKKYNDGIYLDCWDGEIPAQGNSWDHTIIVKAMQSWYKDCKWGESEIADLSEFESESVNKQYRIRVEEEFDGFLVGITHIVTTGRIGTDMTMMPCDMNGNLKEVFHLFKVTDKEKVGVVYFKNNAKRYVLLDDMKYE